MSVKIIIDPITRISGHLSIEVTIEKNIITNAKSSGVLFRGFEAMLKSRPPLDSIYFTERICGICSTSHAIVASLALEDALKITPKTNDVSVRNFMHGCDFLQNAIRQICLYVFPDFVNLNPSETSLNSGFRLDKKNTAKLREDYINALKFSRITHDMLAILGGKAPHTHGVFVGGTTANITASTIIRLKSMLLSVYEFISRDMTNAIYIIAKYYNEYFKIGKGTDNLLTFGLFSDLQDKDLVYVSPAASINGVKSNLDMTKISESVYSSWYSDGKVDLNKPNAYTFIKAPRYEGAVVQVGPIARMILSGNYENKISTMDRLITRVLEAKIISETMLKLLDSILPINTSQEQYIVPETAKGIGAVDATRGALAHFVSIENSVIENYDIITPSAWNLSPIDEHAKPGALENALIGTHIEDMKNPVEIGRIVRSFDPCVSCATHVVTEHNEPFYMEII
ncbi:nickel-dependent hydrogenase large subunit [Clostridium sp.]|uniref:nickel-dependent hydrogenase large subunit n=1 Tax=Clostridium sp. TaxID=1506 RepID=UPI003D6D4460